MSATISNAIFTMSVEGVLKILNGIDDKSYEVSFSSVLVHPDKDDLIKIDTEIKDGENVAILHYLKKEV